MSLGSRHRGDTLRLVLVGCGGQAGGDVPQIASHPAVKIVGLCDPDFKNATRFGDRFEVAEAVRFADYNKLLNTVECDAVFCATPDHMHAPVGLKALSLGRHAYVQKPLARGVGEVRALRLAAEKQPKAATQMGIQIHGEAAYRTGVAWLKAGVIGRVKEIHTFCSKGWGGPQPTTFPDPLPAGLDWDTYCGVALKVPFMQGAYHPGNWRRWQNFGTGTLGDMACHILDPVFTGLDLTTPTSVTSLQDGPPNPLNFPYNAHIVWQLQGTRYTTKNVTLHWYHGDTRPPKDALPDNTEAPGSGSIIVGENGTLMLPHWAIPTVWDKRGKKLEKLPPQEKSISHYHEWVDCALGRKPGKPGAHFGYAAPLTEVVLLGNIASWTPGKTLNWNAAACQFVGEGASEANTHVFPVYRSGREITL